MRRLDAKSKQETRFRKVKCKPEESSPPKRKKNEIAIQIYQTLGSNNENLSHKRRPKLQVDILRGNNMDGLEEHIILEARSQL